MRIVLCLVTIFSCSGCALATLPSSRYSVHVTDTETGAPVTNAFVQTTFQHDYDPWGNRPNKVDRRKSPVDGDGRVTFLGETMESGIGCSVYADGYYPDWVGIEVTEKNVLLNRWEPWNPTFEVKMRPKKNPVPMVEKRVDALKIPIWDKSIGFDVMVGDWVAPYGSGQKSDLFVNMYRRFEHSGDFDAVATITFPNEGDGILLYTVPEEYKSSSFKFPNNAPNDGYQDRLVLERHATLRSSQCNFNPNKDIYIFRLRTELDEDGNVASACYGRTSGRIEIGWGELLDFNYSFNFDPRSRSLESNKKSD